MKIGMCQESSPSDVRMVIADDGSSVDDSVYSRLEANPYDEHALEAAVALGPRHASWGCSILDKADKPTEKQVMFFRCGADRAIIVSNEELET